MHVTKMTVMKAVFNVKDYVYFQYYTIIEEYSMGITHLYHITSLETFRHTQISSWQITVAESNPFPEETNPEMLMLPAMGMRPAW